ncbi:MAG: hypothetical protein JWO22_1645 [Frankiales bacterium]|nr:hypothetical protein [Frankiales bacterium]
MAEFDINKVKGNDRFIAGGAVVFIILSFLHWRTFHLDGLGSHSVKLFGEGSYGLPKLAFFLALAAGAVVIARLTGVLDNLQLPAGVNLITLALSGLATLLLLLQFVLGFGKYFTIPGHPSYGYYLGLLVSAAMTYFAFLNFQASGEKLPEMPSGGGTATPPPPPPAPPAPPPAAPETPTS